MHFATRLYYKKAFFNIANKAQRKYITYTYKREKEISTEKNILHTHIKEKKKFCQSSSFA